MRFSKANRKRVWVYGGFLALLAGGYFYQPVRIDFFPKSLPSPNPPVDPDSKALFSPGAKVMIVTAHPDDAEYYLGGLEGRLLKTGAIVDLVVCTDGDKGFYPWENARRNRQIRRSEQVDAANAWHAHSVTFLGFPDGRLQPKPDVVTAIRRQIDMRKPEWVFSFDGDYPPHVSHGDHRSAGQATAEAVRGAAAKWLMLFATRAPNYTADVSDFEDAQKAYLSHHRSQFYGEKLERVAATVESEANEEGEKAGFTFGVAFRALRP